MDLPQVWTEDTGTGWPQLLTRRENQNVKWNHPNLGAFEKSGPSPCNSPAANLTVWPLPSPGVPPPGQALCRLQKSETGHLPGPGSGFAVVHSRSLRRRVPAAEDRSAVGGAALLSAHLQLLAAGRSI